jgi:FtsP/CotA-like multicopper oxidase with cupredoxin domain
MTHPFHIHDIQFQILDRNGNPPAPGERGLKDTVRVHGGETVRVIARFEDYADPDRPYMYHCHILEHEDAGMMGQFVVV